MPVANEKLKKFKAKDPSRTVMLRRQMLRDIGARMARIKRAVYQSIAIDDDLGLRGDTFAVNEESLVANGRWEFLSNPQKVTAFQGYLKELVDTELLSSANPAAPWTDKYISSAYKQGLTRGFLDSKQAYSRPSPIEPGTVGQFLEGSFASPEATSKLELLGTRMFTNLKGVGAAMDQQLSNTLVLGLAEGRAPGAIAKQMSDQIDGITRQRANTIARTEIIYAHAEGQLDSMKGAGVYEVIVMAEWATAGDDNVCSQCSPLQGVIFTVDEARGMIPRHPGCRCAWLPAAVGEDQKGQAWSDRQSKVLDSIKEETGLTDGKAAREKSRWLGADKKLPNSLTGLKPKGSALKEAAAEAKLNKLKDAKLAIGKANAAKEAAEKAAKRVNIKVGLAQGKLGQAGITADVTEFAGGTISDSLATKILTDGAGELLVSSEEFLQLVAAAKAEPSPVGQVGALLEKRAAVLAARKQAARAAAAKLAKETEQQAAKAAMQAAGGLGEGSFTAEGLLTPQATHVMATELNLTTAQVEALATVGSATEQAAMLETVVTEAKAANTAYLQKMVTKYGIDPQKIAYADAIGDPGAAWMAYEQGLVGKDVKFYDWVKDKPWAKVIDDIPATNPAGRMKVLENAFEKYKAAVIKNRENLADKTTNKIKKLGGFTYKSAAKKLKAGTNEAGEFVSSMTTTAHTYDEVVVALGRIGTEAKAVPLALQPSEIFLLKKGDPGDILKSIQKANFKDQITVVKFDGHYLAISGESEVYAAQLTGVTKVDVSFVDMDAWLAGKKASKAGNAATDAAWVDTGATFSYANATKKIEALDLDFAGAIKLPLAAPDDVAYADYYVAKKAGKDIPAVQTYLDADELQGWATPTTAEMKDALDYAKKSAVDTPLENPWPGVQVTKWNGKYYVSKGTDTAGAAQLAGVDKLSVMLTDLDAVAGAPAALNTGGAFAPTTTQTVLELVGEVKPGEMMTVSQLIAKYPKMTQWISENGKAVNTTWLIKQLAPNAKSLTNNQLQVFSDVVKYGADFKEQMAIIEMFNQTGMVIKYEYIGAAKYIDSIVPLSKVLNKSGSFSKPVLTKLVNAFKIPNPTDFIGMAKDTHVNFQMQQFVKQLPPDVVAKFPPNTLNLVVPKDVNDVDTFLKATKAAHGDLEAKWKIGNATTHTEAQEALQTHVDFSKISIYDFWSTPNNHAHPAAINLVKLEQHIANDPSILKRVKHVSAGPPPAASPVVPVAGPVADVPLPDFKQIKVIKNLPGSTRPQLVEHTTDGTKWVMKAGLDPGHVRSEALADDLYRRAGFAVPKGGIVDTTGGPVKFTEFLDGGETLQEYLRKATGAQKAAAMEQVKDGFVMDALLANHDVGGLSMDNLFVVGEKVYRIDNGGALLYRAQGAAKADFAAVVKEFKTMRDSKVNSVTAELYKGITDKEIHKQIKDIVDARETILAGVPDTALRATLSQRINWLQAQLPQPKVDAALRVHLAASKAPAVYEVDAAAIAKIKRARVNGVNLSGDSDLIEDNNILIWEETGANGLPVTRAQFKVTAKGSDVVVDALPTIRTGGAQAAPVVGAGDAYYDSILNALKTVNIHSKDGAYNMGIMQKFQQTKKEIYQAYAGASDETKAMLTHYSDWLVKVEDAYNDKKTIGELFTVYIPPKAKVSKVVAKDAFVVQKLPQLGDRVNNFKEGAAASTGKIQSYSRSGAGDAYKITGGDGVVMEFVPPKPGAGNGGSSWAGRMVMEVEGPVSPESIQKLRDSLGVLGVNTAAPSAAAEEALYIHKTVYLRGLTDDASYAKIWKSTVSPELKVKQLKTWVKQNMKIDLPDVPTADYNPAGVVNVDGTGFRKWYRWDTPPAETKKKMKDYYLVHYVGGSLSDSYEGDVPETVAAVLNSGGELTSSMSRVRKGVPTKEGASIESDMAFGGADYIFTRVAKRTDKNRGQHGLYFKGETVARADAISYSGDKYGNTHPDVLKYRARTVEAIRDQHTRDRNETVFKHGLSIIDDIDTIAVYNQSEKDLVIAAYKKAGFAVLPDGRKIRDIVEIRP